MPVILRGFPLCTSRTGLWEESQIVRYVLFGPGQTRRYGLTCLQLSCQQPINYCVFSPPNGLSVYIFLKVLLKIVASNLCALISQIVWVIADSLLQAPWALRHPALLHTTLFHPGSLSLETEMGPSFPYLVLKSREWDWDFLLETCHLPCLFLAPLLVYEQNHCIQPCVRRQMGNVPFLFLTRKGPWQPWKELVRLLQSTRPEWRRPCFAQSSHGPRQLPKRPWADKALFLLATPLLGWDPSCWASEPVRVVELCVRSLTFGGFSTLPLTLCIHV